MGHGHSSQNQPIDLSQYNSSYNNMMHQGNLDINNLNAIHMNLGSFTPNMMGQSQASSHSLSASPSMQMFLQQQHLLNSGNMAASMDENDMMQNQQYNQMMRMNSHPSQNQMQYGQSNQYGNFGQYQAYSHQQAMDGSGNYQNQHLSSSSPSMMTNPMLHHNMGSHQMQQMQQHSYYIPPSNQSGYNN
jgi:hypothetical protein